jgi:hypothetical protein
MRTSSPLKPILNCLLFIFPPARALENVSTFLENVVTFFNENIEPTFFWKDLYQHFSRENVRFNIFSERFINIFHKNVDQHFLKMLQHFSG